MTIAAKIEAKRQRLVAIKDELVVLRTLAEADDFEGFDDEQQLTIDTLTDEEAGVIKSIESLEKVEQGLAAKAQPVGGAPVPKGTGGAFPKEEKSGDLLVKLGTAHLLSHMTQTPLVNVMEIDHFKQDDRVKAAMPLVSKTAVGPATTTQAGWAAELVRDDLEAFLTDLAPVSIYAAMRQNSFGLDFGTANSVTIPRRAGSNTDAAGAFVGEGGVIPVKRITLASQQLFRYKMAVISAFTNEILEQSIPSIEALVRNAMNEDTAVALDGVLLDANAAVTGVRPAGILNGVTGTASAGNTVDDIITDLKVIINAIQAGNPGARIALVMNNARLIGLSTVTNAVGAFVFRDEIAQGRLLGMPVIASTTCPANTVVGVDLNSFAAANATPTFNVSDQATLVMANADGVAPTQAVDAAGELDTAEQVNPGGGISVNGGPSGAGTAGAEAVSMYQTASTALRMILPTSWGMVRTGVVKHITNVNW